MALNVTTAVFGENCNTATASPSLAQWDTEQVLQISGIDLPDSYKVEFSTMYTRNAIPAIGDASGVAIPNVLLQRSAPITAYVVLYGENGGRNREYWITIHITPGQPPETTDPDPEQADIIDQAIAALNNGVARTEAAATSAEGSASDAADHAADAEAWAAGQRDGVDVGTEDPTYHNNSKYYAGRAEEAAEEAGQHEASWESWARRAETAADDAERSARAAAGSKADAETAAQTATQKATEAGNSAAAAAGSASEARQTVDGAIGAINTARDGALTQIGSAGSNATAAVNQAGTMQTGRVTTEGNTQVNRVQTKGAEVLDSIPQDYSDLVDDVDDLSRHLSDVTEAVEDISKRINLFDKRTVVSGGYFSSAGGILPNANSEYSTQYIKVDPSKTYSMSKAKTGAEFLTYNQNEQFISGGRITPSTNINFSFGSGVYYVRLSFYNTTFGNDFMLVEGATVPSTYVGYINYIEGSSVLPGSLDVSALPASISDSINANTGAFSREIRDNANWTFYGNYFPSSAGTQNASANYNEYYFVAPSDFEIWTDTDLWSGTDCDDFWLKLYTGLPFGTETNVTGVYRQRKNSSGVITSDTMPKENSKLKVTAGQYVVISYYETVSYFRFMVSGLESAYYYGNDKIVLSEDTCKQIAASDAFKTCKFIYNAYTGPYPGDFYHTERVCIYLPAKYGYVRHSLYHCVLESAYADSWRLAPSLACDDNYIKRFNLTVGGEWEFAVKLNGRDDFSGGVTHGDEIYTNITFFLDGEEITITDYTALTLFNELRVVETTDVYDPADHTIVIGVHTREYVFNSDGLRLRQTMKWAGVFPVLNAYMPMYLPAKTSNGITVTNEIVLDSNYTPFSIPASRFNYTFPDTKNCVIYSAESAATQAVDCTWQVVNVAHSGEFNLTDNANNNYNKIYYRTVENTVYNTSENELWKSEQHVKISISDNS